MNVCQHAYQYPLQDSQESTDSTEGRWWMFAQQINNQLYLLLADMGDGIPKTLPKIDNWEKIRPSLPFTDDDSNMIMAATQLERSQSEESGRGFGLQDIINFAKNNPGGEIMIYSNKGLYSYDSKEEKPIEHKHSLNGTLIQWKISLGES